MGARPSDRLRQAAGIAEEARAFMRGTLADRWRGGGAAAYQRHSDALLRTSGDLVSELQEAAELARAYERAVEAAVPGPEDPQ